MLDRIGEREALSVSVRKHHRYPSSIMLLTNISLVNILFYDILLSNQAFGDPPMARVPITVMGFRCDRCGHEWIPRRPTNEGPRVCPKCHSPYWKTPGKRPRMTYDDFKTKIGDVLRGAGSPLTWTEVRTAANLPQAYPNNQWVHRMETDIGLVRRRESDGIIHWLLKDATLDLSAPTPPQASSEARSRTRGR
jgi:hypothetical protein